MSEGRGGNPLIIEDFLSETWFDYLLSKSKEVSNHSEFDCDVEFPGCMDIVFPEFKEYLASKYKEQGIKIDSHRSMLRYYHDDINKPTGMHTDERLGDLVAVICLRPGKLSGIITDIDGELETVSDVINQCVIFNANIPHTATGYDLNGRYVLVSFITLEKKPVVRHFINSDTEFVGRMMFDFTNEVELYNHGLELNLSTWIPRIWNDIVNGNMYVLILESNDNRIGMLGYRIVPYSFNADKLIIYEEFWYVKPEFRGKGKMGILLMNQLEQEAKENNCHAIIMATMSINNISKYYQRTGYSKLEEHYIKVL